LQGSRSLALRPLAHLPDNRICVGLVNAKHGGIMSSSGSELHLERFPLFGGALAVVQSNTGSRETLAEKL
jgi:hypothetical protein